jgi:ABC-type Co2+ transport system permease subunit
VATVYSRVIAQILSASGTSSLGTCPDGETWVVRFAAATFGDYVGYVSAALQVGDGAPGLYLFNSKQTSLIGVHKSTFFWEGRLVVAEGNELNLIVANPDTCDFYCSGYVLTN